jgi:hypothetical protein
MYTGLRNGLIVIWVSAGATVWISAALLGLDLAVPLNTA